MTRKGDPQSQWTRKQEMTVCHMKETGRSIAEIAAAVGKTYGAVSVRLSALGATKKIGRTRRKRGEFLKAVAGLCGPHMKNKRMSDREIAAALGAYPQEVFKARTKLGIRRQISPKEGARRAARSRNGSHPWWSIGRNTEKVRSLTAAQRDLVAANTALAYKLAAAHLAGWPAADPDVVESAALYLLCVAAHNYDPDSGAKFGTYAYKTIKLGIAREMYDAATPLGFRSHRERHLTPPRVGRLLGKTL